MKELHTVKAVKCVQSEFVISEHHETSWRHLALLLWSFFLSYTKCPVCESFAGVYTSIKSTIIKFITKIIYYSHSCIFLSPDWSIDHIHVAMKLAWYSCEIEILPNRCLPTPLFCTHALRSSLECEIGNAVEPFREKNYNVKPACHKIYQGRYYLLIFSSFS